MLANIFGNVALAKKKKERNRSKIYLGIRLESNNQIS